MARFVLLILMVCACFAGDVPPAAPASVAELERLDSMIEELSALKAQVSQTEAKIDGMLRALSEQRGALLTKPASYNALKVTQQDDGGPAEVKKPLIRCKALTSSGKRCTRAVIDGHKYCKQHTLAHQK